MWIGNSMLFNWLDRNLERPRGTRQGPHRHIWMVHSGGFYQVEKKHLAPSQMPEDAALVQVAERHHLALGISLLILVFYMAAAVD
jgi:uncharacterized membrane protein